MQPQISKSDSAPLKILLFLHPNRPRNCGPLEVTDMGLHKADGEAKNQVAKLED